jgi:hypothetical protein
MEGTIVTGSLAAAGSATGSDAAQRATREALAGLVGPAELVLAFPSGVDPADAARRCAQTAGGAPIAGITGNAVIGSDGALEEGFAAIAFGMEIEVGIGVVRPAGRLRGAARAATREALDQVDPERGHPLVLLFLDTRTGDQAEAVAGAYEEAGPQIPLAGGAAGGADPFQISGSRALTEHLMAVAIVSPRPIGLGVAHGCKRMGLPAIVTGSEGRRLLELDGRPAAEVYLERLGFEAGELSDEQFEMLAVTHPLAQPELGGQDRIRHVLGREGDTLVCATHLPPNAAIEFTSESPDDIIAASGQAVSESVAALEGEQPRAALLFDCAGRKRAVGGALSLEVAALLETLPQPSPPLAGLFTHGEVARIRGAKGDRNHAVVAVTFA